MNVATHFREEKQRVTKRWKHQAVGRQLPQGEIRPCGQRGNMTNKTKTSPASRECLLDNHDPNMLLSTDEVARRIGVKPKTIRRYASRRLLNYILVGNRLRFRPAAVELFLSQREVRA
jgi:excisionase family DNA binding protein